MKDYGSSDIGVKRSKSKNNTKNIFITFDHQMFDGLKEYLLELKRHLLFLKILVEITVYEFRYWNRPICCDHPESVKLVFEQLSEQFINKSIKD